MQFYASPEQIMRDRSEYARKNISRGRNVVVLTYEGGVLLVAENLAKTLHKISEIYDRIGFAAVGRYNEYEILRAGGVRMADLRGYSFSRRDVTARWLANAYAQTLGAIFTDQTKPYEVELCVAEVGASPEQDELYRLTYDGSVQAETGFLAMGGQADVVFNVLRQDHRLDLPLAEALRLAVRGLGAVGGEGGAPRTIPAGQLEVAVLDRRRVGRTFRRVTGAALVSLLNGDAAPAPATGTGPAAGADATARRTTESAPAGSKPTEGKPADSKPAGTKPAGTKPADSKPAGGTATGGKARNGRPGGKSGTGAGGGGGDTTAGAAPAGAPDDAGASRAEALRPAPPIDVPPAPPAAEDREGGRSGGGTGTAGERHDEGERGDTAPGGGANGG